MYRAIIDVVYVLYIGVVLFVYSAFRLLDVVIGVFLLRAIASSLQPAIEGDRGAQIAIIFALLAFLLRAAQILFEVRST
jgi:hypothetical protein